MRRTMITVQLSELTDCLRRPAATAAAPNSPMSNARSTESDGNTTIASITSDTAITSPVAHRGASTREHSLCTSPAMTMKCPPDTAIRCMMPLRRNCSSSSAAYAASTLPTRSVPDDRLSSDPCDAAPDAVSRTRTASCPSTPTVSPGTSTRA